MKEMFEKEFTHSVQLTERVYMLGECQRVERILTDDKGNIVCREDYPIASFCKGELGRIAGLVHCLSNPPANEDAPTKPPRLSKRTSKARIGQKIHKMFCGILQKSKEILRSPFSSDGDFHMRFVILSDTVSASDYLNILAHIELFPSIVFLNPVELSTEPEEGPFVFRVEMWRGMKLTLRTELTREGLALLANRGESA